MTFMWFFRGFSRLGERTCWGIECEEDEQVQGEEEVGGVEGVRRTYQFVASRSDWSFRRADKVAYVSFGGSGDHRQCHAARRHTKKPFQQQVDLQCRQPRVFRV